MSDKIKDRIIDGMSEQVLKGAVMQFDYRGWLVSFSQVFTPASIAIFKGDVEIYSLSNVENAIDQINKFEARNDE